MLAVDGEVELCLTTDGENFTWRVLVAPIGEDCLLGIYFPCAQEFLLSANSGFSLRGKAVSLEWRGRPVPPGRVVLLKSEIPANSVCLLSAHLCSVPAESEVSVEPFQGE